MNPLLEGFQVVLKEHPMVPRDQVIYKHKEDTGLPYNMLYVGNMYSFIFNNSLNMYPMTWDQKLNFLCEHARRSVRDHMDYFIKNSNC